MSTLRTHFTFRVDTWTPDGESIVEHIAGVRGLPSRARHLPRRLRTASDRAHNEGTRDPAPCPTHGGRLMTRRTDRTAGARFTAARVLGRGRRRGLERSKRARLKHGYYSREAKVERSRATRRSTPRVFNAGEDPVALGLVTSINRPGGNATGIYIFIAEMDTKRLELLRELVPNAALIAVLLNPTWIRFKTVTKEIAEAARAAGQRIDIIEASNEHEIHGAFKRIARLRPQALLVGADPFFNARREQLVTLANHYAIPAVYELREFAVAGGLMSYGTTDRGVSSGRRLGLPYCAAAAVIRQSGGTTPPASVRIRWPHTLGVPESASASFPRSLRNPACGTELIKTRSLESDSGASRRCQNPDPEGQVRGRPHWREWR
jgi:ABC transporter substrate binding protein